MTAAKKSVLLVAAEQWIPWTKINATDDGNATISGPMNNILNVLASQLDFDYKIIRPSDGVWGSRKPDGNWTGMIGMLQRQEVEFAMGPFGVSIQREAVCDFSDAISSYSNAILLKRPTLQSDMSGFLKPFTPEVWLLVLLSIFSMCAAMFLFASAEGYIFNHPRINYLSRAFLWVLQTLTQESSEWLPKKDAGRLLVATWLLASLVFMSSYSGILTAMLTVPIAAIRIDSLEDLVFQKDIPWRLEQGSFLFQYLQDAKGEIQRTAFEGSSGTLPDCWTVRQEVLDGEYAAICDRTTMKKVIAWDFSNSGRCHLYISRENVLGGSILSMAFQTKSPYLPKANKIINTLKEAGFMEKWLGDQITNTSQCLKPPSSDKPQNVQAIGIHVLSGPFLALTGGLMFAVLVLGCEVIWSKTKERPDTTKEPSVNSCL